MSKQPEKIKAKLDPLVDRLNELGKRDAEIAIYDTDYDVLSDKKEREQASRLGFQFLGDCIIYRWHKLKRV